MHRCSGLTLPSLKEKALFDELVEPTAVVYVISETVGSIVDKKTTGKVLRWDSSVPSGVAADTHLVSLCMLMSQLFFGNGARGVFLMHPVLASILSLVSPTRFGDWKWGRSIEQQNSDESQRWRVGDFGGVEVWADLAVAEEEVLLTECPDDLQDIAKIVVENLFLSGGDTTLRS